MNERDVQPRRRLRDMGRAVRVDAHRRLGLGFGLVDPGVGGGVDDHVAADAVEGVEDAGAIGKIAFGPPERDDFETGRRRSPTR